MSDESPDGESEWRFGLDDVGEESDVDEMEPGTLDAEHTAFVLLGVAVALVVLYAAMTGL